jgi:ribonuclease HI
MNAILVYTDGACSGNPGPGGWGAVIECGGQTHEICGNDPSTTNNRMELMAAIKALEYVAAQSAPGIVTIYTDSMYLRDGITKWIHSWKKNNWRRSGGKEPVKNIDLWQALDAVREGLAIEWRWVKGHAVSAGNNRADFLATSSIKTGVV